MRLRDLNWMDVENYLETDSRIILLTGATEQHAYLSLMTDVLMLEHIADAVAKETQVLVAPPLNFGVSHHFVEFPGTISLSQHTFEYAVTEIVESLFHQGFRRFLILNGHRRNRIPPQIKDFQMDGIIRVLWHDWWRSPAVEALAAEHQLRLDHANWYENFAFNRVADDMPTGEKEPINLEYLEDRYYAARETLGDGCYGGPYQASEDIMNALFATVVADVTRLVEDLHE